MQRNFRATAKPPDPKVDLLIFKKAREMIAYGNDCLYNKQFPRKYRVGNAIGAQIERAMYDILDGLTEAATKEHKKTALTQVDHKILYLRQLLITAVDPKMNTAAVLIPLDSQRKWCEMLEEMGKILGSWLKKLNS
ncbi:MAG: four helix bundle protein [Eubacterium sp.]|jgi:hypothetical protein|nr:four helix bundle protein [Eubacterium sp.]NBH97157.1 four helix bundle protein [Lachnospiraceae bacterium]